MSTSFTEIAVWAATEIARRQGRRLESFSLTAVEIDGDEITLQASCRVSPAVDEIPFEETHETYELPAPEPPEEALVSPP